MDGHIEQALLEFQHPQLKVPHHAPSHHEPPKCGQRTQHAKIDDADELDLLQINHTQQVIGKLLHCGRAVDPTMLHAINNTSMNAARGAEATMKATVHLLNCAATHTPTQRLSIGRVT